MLYCIVLYCIVLYCIVLYCIVLRASVALPVRGVTYSTWAHAASNCRRYYLRQWHYQ